MSQPTADARAVVRALDALTTQVKRIADHTANPASFALAPPVVGVDDDATTPATTCSAQHRRFDDGRECIRAAQHQGDHIDERGFQWPDTAAVYPLADSTVRVGRRPPMDPVHILGAEPDRDADDTCRRMHRGANAEDCLACAGTNPPYPFICPGHPSAEEQQRTARRASLRNLLTRVNKGALTTEECALLWQHVDTEMREHDTMRAVAAGNKRHVQTIAPEIDRLQRELGLTRGMLDGDSTRTVDEMVRFSEQLLAGRETWKAKAEEIERDRDRLVAELEYTEQRVEAAYRTLDTRTVERDQARGERDRSDEAARRALEQRQEMAEERFVIQGQRDRADRLRAEVQRDRDQHAAVLREVLGIFAEVNGHGAVKGYHFAGVVDPEQFERWRSMVAPTVERPWWEQVAVYENEAVEATRHVLELKAAIERVRAVQKAPSRSEFNTLANAQDNGWDAALHAVHAALDGSEQPTTEA